ncbi:hypothetical protein C7266_20855 [Klebsiella variicola]|nr:hypothetical protein [Klebsiella variicola]
MSGSSSALLHKRPLRTVRASFPAYRSSLYKLLFYQKPASLLCNCRWQLGCSRIRLSRPSSPP